MYLEIRKKTPMAFDHSWKAVLNPGMCDDFFMGKRPLPFSVDDKSYNPVNAWWLSELSRLIYLQDHTEGFSNDFSRNDFLERVGLVERTFFNTPAMQFALVEPRETVKEPFSVVVFRGTTGHVSNWRINFDIALSPWPAGGAVHRGFKSIIMTHWDAIDKTLQRIKNPLLFTGHSLGGALAVLTASLRPAQSVYTFGAPRCGNAAFVKAVSPLPIFNVINPNDIVAELPPSGRRARFAHAGSLIQNNEVPFSRRLFFQAPSFLADHAPLNYTAQLSVAFDN
jgi:triacylglycerol lipase